MINNVISRRAFVGIFLFVAATLGAQTSVSVGPYIGYYRPFGHFEPASVYSSNLPQEPEDLAGAAYGVDADAWLGKHVGASLEAGVTRSTVGGVDTPDGPRGPTSARVETVVAQALIALPRALGSHSWISGGVGVVRHAGDAYAGLSSLSQAAGAVGAGTRGDVSGRMSLSAGITALWYTLNVPMPSFVASNPGSLERGRQFDVTIHVGAAWSIL